MGKTIFVTDNIGKLHRAADGGVTFGAVNVVTDQLLPNNPKGNNLPNNPVIQPAAEPAEKLVGRAAFIQRQANAWQEKLVEQHRTDMAAVMPEVSDPGYEREMDKNGIWGDPNNAASGAQAFHAQSATAWKGKK
jgi:hypothetical protein